MKEIKKFFKTKAFIEFINNKCIYRGKKYINILIQKNNLKIYNFPISDN